MNERPADRDRIKAFRKGSINSGQRFHTSEIGQRHVGRRPYLARVLEQIQLAKLYALRFRELLDEQSRGGKGILGPRPGLFRERGTEHRGDGLHIHPGAENKQVRAVTFQLFDTGGLYGASNDPLHELVVRQGQRAIADGDLLVFLVDGREGMVSADEEIARELHETGTPVLLSVNKTDDKRAQA